MGRGKRGEQARIQDFERKKRRKGAQKKGGENSPISPPLVPRLGRLEGRKERGKRKRGRLKGRGERGIVVSGEREEGRGEKEVGSGKSEDGRGKRTEGREKREELRVEMRRESAEGRGERRDGQYKLLPVPRLSYQLPLQVQSFKSATKSFQRHFLTYSVATRHFGSLVLGVIVPRDHIRGITELHCVIQFFLRGN